MTSSTSNIGNLGSYRGGAAETHTDRNHSEPGRKPKTPGTTHEAARQGQPRQGRESEPRKASKKPVRKAGSPREAMEPSR